MAYLSPEQVKPGVSDERSDVYSAGIVLFEMLTGTPPFTGTEAISVAYRHVNEDVPPPSEFSAGVSDVLDDVVLAATRRDPNQRPADAAALLQLVRAVPKLAPPIDLQQTMVVPIPVSATAVRHDTAVTAAAGAATGVAAEAGTDPAAEATPPDDGTSPASRQALDPEAHRKRSRRRGLVALALVLALAVAAGAFAWWLGSGRNTTVPRVTGLTAQTAKVQLESEGLEVEFADEQYSEIVKAGEVISSDPEQGAEVRSGSTVTLVVSKGPERYDVPNVVGDRLDDAKKQIRQRHLEVGEVTRRYSENIETGIVMIAKPDVGTSVSPDTAVDLVVSKGLPPVTVPDLVGDTTESAQDQLAKRSLKYKESSEEYDNKIPAGAVISQDPVSGASVPQGSTVSVVVSLGPPLVEVPDVFDFPVERAIADSRGGRLQVQDVRPVRRQSAQPGGYAGSSRRNHGSQGQRRRTWTHLMPTRSKKSRSSGPLIGAHVPTSGGLAKRGLAYAEAIGAECVQVFVTNPRGWAPAKGDPLQDVAFREVVTGSLPAYVHASFLINLGSPDAAIADKSATSLAHTIERARQIGARGVVVHTGSAVAKDRYDHAMTQTRDLLLPILDALPEDAPPVLLEPTAGQGQSLCSTLDELDEYLHRLEHHPRLGICVDTCHFFAAGHDLAADGGMNDFLDHLEKVRRHRAGRTDPRQRLDGRLGRQEGPSRGNRLRSSGGRSFR